MASRVLEVNEEHISKERPPRLFPVNAGKSGNVIIEILPKMMRFDVFGRRKTLEPRSITLMSRIEDLRVLENILGSGRREERKLLPLGSDHPEEVIRYWNYARLAKGKVLVYRLGLGLFPRMAVHAKEIVIVEPDPCIRNLVWPSVSGCEGNCSTLIPGDFSVFSKATGRFDFIFIDPIPYTGRSSSMMAVDCLPELNLMINIARKVVSTGGAIAVRGYKDLVSMYQQRCQKLINDVRASLAIDWGDKGQKLSSMDHLFYTWALKNRGRVLERVDYKFINAWARKTALTVT